MCYTIKCNQSAILIVVRFYTDAALISLFHCRKSPI
nr:MAG TPA: hypothetical protein [Caudoviricetes sp.]